MFRYYCDTMPRQCCATQSTLSVLQQSLVCPATVSSLLQYEIVDLGCVLMAAGFIATRPSGQLHAIRPPNALMSAPVLAPLVFFTVYYAVMQVISYAMLNREQWYQNQADKVCSN